MSTSDAAAAFSTLADLQRGMAARSGGSGPSGALPGALPQLPLKVERTRTFDTPEFRGMTFLEVESKTALNRVHGMPFKWSINPYRGCSHACSYCLQGDTPVLMADGRTRRIADLRAGDRVYGTERRGAYRRYVAAEVLDHWETRKEAYRVRLADGTELIASGDHRFLTERGWKHVTGAGSGPGQRPHLTTSNELRGVGAFADGPKGDNDYRRGYLCGMVRGDGHLGSYAYERAGRTHGDVHRFRLALVDDEALERTASYLEQAGVPVRWFLFADGADGRKPARAIRNQSLAGVRAVERLIAWPETPSEEWCRGFLAGIFDAEGSYSRGVLRIHNKDAALLRWTAHCLTTLGLPFVREPARPNGCAAIRVTGGLQRHLRFFHLTDPAITRKRVIDGQAIKSRADLRVVSVEPLGITIPMYDITTGTGDFIANGVVSHNCFARPTHTYLNLDAFGDFEKTVVVKTNVADVLRHELSKKSWTGEHVAMGTNTDPYQRCEGRYRLMPDIIRALGESLTPFSILTKGTLITRDLDVLTEAARRVEVRATLTIGMLDERLWRSSEPGTPSPRARLDAARALNEAGIPTGVMLAPIMPGLNDQPEQLAELVDAAADAGATHINPIVLHLRPGVREVFWPWLEREHPELVPRYRALYARTNAEKSYREPVEQYVRTRRRIAFRLRGRSEQTEYFRSREPAERELTAGGAGDQLTLL